MKSKLIVALEVDRYTQAAAPVKELANVTNFFKVGRPIVAAPKPATAALRIAIVMASGVNAG